LRGAGGFRSRLFAVVTFAGMLAAGSAWFTQCQPAARNVPVGGARVSCPDRPAVSLQWQQEPGLANTVVPGSPVGLLACRFHGRGQPQPDGSFAAAATFRPSNFVTALNRPQPPVKPAPGIMCPVPTGGVIVLRFVYADGHILNVNVYPNPFGCSSVDNGKHSAELPQSVLSTLEATLGHDELPTA
jgi:hypothetical protein